MKDINQRDIYEGLFPTDAFSYSKPGTSSPTLGMKSGWTMSAPTISATTVNLGGAQFPPAGSLIFMAANVKASPPFGYLYCDGTAVSRTTYAALFAAIAETHGQGDNSTTFNLPDYRGRFLRGQADGQATDPDRAARTAMAAGGNTGDNIGSVQGHMFEDHRHSAQLVMPQNIADADRGTNGSWFSIDGEVAIAGAVTGTRGTETRPVNAYIQIFIKT